MVSNDLAKAIPITSVPIPSELTSAEVSQLFSFHIVECTLIAMENLNACTIKIRYAIVYWKIGKTITRFIIQQI